MPQLMFEYVDNENVYKFSTPHAALSAVCRTFNQIVVEEGKSYQEYCYQMLSFLRFMPKQLLEESMIVRSEEEGLRNRVLHILWYREDLVRYFFKDEVLDEEDVASIVDLFERNHAIPNIADDSPKAFEDFSIREKKKIVSLINSLDTKYGKGLLSPYISHHELERLLTTGKTIHCYTCRNNAQFAFILSTLAHLGVIDKTNYYVTTCQYKRLLRIPKQDKNGNELQLPLKSCDLKSACYQICNPENATYTTIRNYILKALTTI